MKEIFKKSKKILICTLLSFILIVTVGIGVFVPTKGYCLSCIWTGACYGSDSICGSGCVCVKRDSLDTSGFCAVR